MPKVQTMETSKMSDPVHRVIDFNRQRLHQSSSFSRVTPIWMYVCDLHCLRHNAWRMLRSSTPAISARLSPQSTHGGGYCTIGPIRAVERGQAQRHSVGPCGLFADGILPLSPPSSANTISVAFVPGFACERIGNFQQN